jgi:excisionase family DNA binding protein
MEQESPAPAVVERQRAIAPAGTLLLTPEEAATELRISGRQVERMVREGSLKAVRIGKRGRMRIRREDLERFVARLKTTQEMGAEAWR